MKSKRVVATPLRPSHARSATGELLDMETFEQRCGWLLDLTREVFNATSPAWWNPAHLNALIAGVDASGTALPASGFVAADRLGWHLALSEGLYLPDRFQRGVSVRLMATFRARREEIPLLEAMVPLVNGAGEFNAADIRATPAGQWATHVQFTRLARSITRFRKQHACDPEQLTDLFAAPQVTSPVFPFSACDRQFAVMTREQQADGTLAQHLTLRVKLPVVARPSSRKDWDWHTVHLNLPVFRQAVESWCLPDLRLQAGKMLFTCASHVPAVANLEQEVAVGVDWSPSSLLCAGVVRQEQGRLMTDGQASGWEDGGQLSKLLRLQREEEHTRRKANHLATLLRRHPNAVTQHQWAVLDAQQRALSLKRVRLGRSLAWQGANHLVSLAVQSGASLIAFEDLRDLDTTGRGVFQNNRSSQSVRGVLYTCTEQAASRHGIEVVQVPARGTSAKCPCCDGPVSRPQGYHSAACTACGLTGNRDVVACVNIAKRALLGRNKMARPKGGVKRIRETLHAPVTVQTDTLLSRASRQPRRQKSTRSLVLPKPRIRRDRAGNRTQSKHPKRFPARVSLRGQVERTSLNVTGNLAKRELPGLLKDTVPDGVLIEV